MRAWVLNSVEHDFNGHQVNGIHGVKGKKWYDRAFHLANKFHYFTELHYTSGKFCYDDFFRKTHARLYWLLHSVVKAPVMKVVESHSLSYVVPTEKRAPRGWMFDNFLRSQDSNHPKPPKLRTLSVVTTGLHQDPKTVTIYSGLLSRL